jgi:pimeloyl-ACP methyl ester carboxylesterase
MSPAIRSALVAALVTLLASRAITSRAAAAAPEPAEDESGSVPRDGFELHYRVVGDGGPYIVILSGGPGLDVDYMESITEELKKTHRCVLLEQRGTGRSKLHPSEQEALAFWSEPARWELDPDRALWEYLRAITPTDFFDRAKGLEHAMRWEPDWCHGRVGEIAEKTIWVGMDLRPRLSAITCPVLFIHGYQDVAGEANMLEAKANITNATLRFVHRAGHYPWVEQPDETWKVVLPFLDALPR